MMLTLATLVVASLGLMTPATAATRADKPKKTEAAPKLNVTIETFGGTKFRLTLADQVDSKVMVLVRSEDASEILYKSALSSLNGKVFDLSPLADGTYVFEVAAGDRKFTQTFELKTQINRVALAKN